MKPNIRCALTENGDIEAAYRDGSITRRVVIDRRSGALLTQQNAPYGSDAFRWCIREARKFVASYPPSP